MNDEFSSSRAALSCSAVNETVDQTFEVSGPAIACTTLSIPAFSLLVHGVWSMASRVKDQLTLDDLSFMCGVIVSFTEIEKTKKGSLLVDLFFQEGDESWAITREQGDIYNTTRQSW